MSEPTEAEKLVAITAATALQRLEKMRKGIEVIRAPIALQMEVMSEVSPDSVELHIFRHIVSQLDELLRLSRGSSLNPEDHSAERNAGVPVTDSKIDPFDLPNSLDEDPNECEECPKYGVCSNCLNDYGGP